MIEHSQGIKALIAALKGVQGMVEGVKRDADNPHFRSRYATLEAVVDAARPALQANGFAFTQAPGAIVDGAVEITTMLMHESGEWLRSTLHVPLGKRDPQGLGSALTYGQRYSLMATLGLPPTDDDGETAMDRSRDNAGDVRSTGGDVRSIATAGGRKSAYQARKDGRWKGLVAELRKCPTQDALESWREKNDDVIREFPPGWVVELREEYARRAYEIKTGR